METEVFVSSAYGLTDGSAPFRESGWRGAKAVAAHAYWSWHEALSDPLVPNLDGADRAAFFEAQRTLVYEDGDVTVVPPAVWSAVRRVADSPEQRNWLAEQVQAARVLSEPEVSFQTRSELLTFIHQRAASHALLLADLANAARQFQRSRVEALAEAFFLHARLVDMRGDANRARSYFPDEEFAGSGVTFDDLMASPPAEPARKVVWRRIVWIRDAFARGMPLSDELDRGHARQLRTSVLLSLEILSQIERRGYDVGAFKSGLSRYHRAQARIQARFGRTTWY